MLIGSNFASFAEQAEARLATIPLQPPSCQNAIPMMEIQLPPPITTSQAIPDLLSVNSFSDTNSAFLSNSVYQQENTSLNPSVHLLDYDISDSDWYILWLSPDHKFVLKILSFFI